MVAEKLSNEDKKQALDLVSQSQTFARSDRLRGLLQFICTAEMEGRQDSLNEYVIGVEALGRPEGYSPSEDSCVRSRIYELRQRLEKFYATEAPDATLRIDLPKGSYVPRYVRSAILPVEEPVDHTAPISLSAPEYVPPPAASQQPSASPRRYLTLLAAFIAGAGLTYGIFLYRNNSGNSDFATRPRSAPHWTADLESIWSPLLDPRTPVLVSFQSRLFISFGNSLVVRDTSVDSFARVESSPLIMRTKELFGVPQVYENRNYTDFGAASACLLLGRLLGDRQPDILAKRSSDVTWDDLAKYNLIVLGKPNADPDIARLLPKDHFSIEGGTIRNLQPQPGEAQVWTDKGNAWDRSNNWTEKYGLITMIPGPHPGRRILSLGGAGSEHLWALTEFLTNAESARNLAAKLRTPSGEFPSSWQAVVRADFKAQAPVRVEYMAHRNLDSRQSASR